MPMLRFFRHSDGTFAHFNGMGTTPAELLLTLLAYDDSRGAPLSNAPHSGYQRIETGGDRLADLHLWQVGPGHAAVIMSVVSDAPQEPSAYKQRLKDLGGLSHVTVEVNRCAHAAE